MTVSRILTFEDNRTASTVFGIHDCHLSALEPSLKVTLTNRGNEVRIQGSAAAVEKAATILKRLYARAMEGKPIDGAYVTDMVRHGDRPASTASIVLHNRQIPLKTRRQAEFVDKIEAHTLTFGLGPAGTGKTFLAAACGLAHVLSERTDRLILSRPAVEAGENLGFLPGDLVDKTDPYLRPVFDALHQMIPAQHLQRLRDEGVIEIAPLAYMRGRNLKRAFVLLDEAQNATMGQMRMFLTRLEEGSKMVITGDLTQSDLPVRSGLEDAVSRLGGIEDIAMHTFEEQDIVRHALVEKIVHAYGRSR